MGALRRGRVLFWLVLSGCDGGASAAGAGGSAGSADCWDSDAWTVERFDTRTLGGDGAGAPMLAPDGLTLFYTAHTSMTAPARPFSAKRASPSEPFSGGSVLVNWPGVDPVDHPWVVADELFVGVDHGAGNFEMAVSRFDGAEWLPPEALGPEVNTEYSNNDAAVTSDGLTMLFSRSVNDGTLNFRLYQATRPNLGAAFGSVEPVSIPVIGPLDLLLCATLSSDGRRLFFSTSYPNDLSSLPPNGVTVWFTERSAVDAPWSEPIHVSAVDGQNKLTCAAAVSGDGCELWVQHFVPMVGEIEYVVATRR